MKCNNDCITGATPNLPLSPLVVQIQVAILGQGLEEGVYEDVHSLGIRLSANRSSILAVLYCDTISVKVANGHPIPTQIVLILRGDRSICPKYKNK